MDQQSLSQMFWKIADCIKGTWIDNGGYRCCRLEKEGGTCLLIISVASL